MIFILINAIIILAVMFLLIILSMIWPPDSPWAPWWRTKKKVAREICRMANINPKDLVYELGSGDAMFLRVAAKEFGANGVGIEIDPLRILLSKFFIKKDGLSDKIKIIRSNFFDVNLSDATVVFVYLVPKVLEKLKPKFLKELKPGTMITSYRYKINLPLLSCDKKNEIYLYKIKKRQSNSNNT